jgi:putative MFS transporter
MPTPSSCRPLLIVAALGYFVDIFDLVLFAIVRTHSLKDLGITGDALISDGVFLLNTQMIGLLIGGLFWGTLGDKKGRLTVLFGSILLYSLANIANGFVTDVTGYALCRFFGGIGLAGELGAGITLVLESLPKEKRGLGASIVAGFGLLGAVAAALVGDLIPWREAYFIGGGMGLVLLVLRVGVSESGLFHKVQQNDSVSRGNIFQLFQNKQHLQKYLYCILVGTPTWFTMGVLGVFSPEIAKALGVQGAVTSGIFILYFYAGAALGDVASGVLSQYLQSRRKTLAVFMAGLLACNAFYLNQHGATLEHFYYFCTVMGFFAGYWAILVINAGEQFGTNIRATVTTSIPNFVRGSVVPMTLGMQALRGDVGLLGACAIVGVVVYALAFWARHKLQETFHKDLDYTI